MGHSDDWNKNIFTLPFFDIGTDILFLNGMVLIRSKMQCNSSGHNMSWYTEPNIPWFLVAMSKKGRWKIVLRA
jgi:hypothetical protein